VTRKPIPAPQAVTIQHRMVALARERRDEAAALRAESRQAQRHARALREDRHAILDAVVTITNEVLARRRLAPAEPVVAKFQTDERGSSGIEIIVTLEDPTYAALARRAIIERFGGQASTDSIIVT
jgi:hypothetical protein